jgi:hypothetical protein
MPMSPNSIKILKNQSKRQKLKRLIQLSLIVLSTFFFVGVIIFYLLPDTPVSFHTTDEHTDKNSEMQNDLQGVDIKSQTSDSQDSFERLFNQQDQKLSTDTSKASVLDSQKKTQLSEKTKVESILQQPSTQIEIPKKASTSTKDLAPKAIKNVPNIKVTEPVKANQPSFNQPLRIDSIDAIILLELDMPVSPSGN